MRAFEVKQKSVHTKVYKYNVKIVKKGLEGSFRLKHIIQIFIWYTLRAFEFKQKKKKIEFDRLPVKPDGIPDKPAKPAGIPAKPTGIMVGTG